MRRLIYPVTIFLLLVQSGLGQDDIVRLETDLVTVDVRVLDARGNPVLDLTSSEVRLLEDNKPRALAFFTPVAERSQARPIACVLALDVSGSIRAEEVALQRIAALKFMELLSPESLFAVVAFGDEFQVLQKFTSKPDEVARAFEKARGAGGLTRILDTIDEAISLLKKAPASRGGRRLRRVVVVITDGYENASVISEKELRRRAAASEVTVFSITLPSYARSLDGGKSVRLPTILDATRIVPNTGGIDVTADSHDFTPMFRAIAEEVTGSYELGFYPPPEARDGRFHELRVEVTRPGVTLRVSRQGYVAGTGR